MSRSDEHQLKKSRRWVWVPVAGLVGLGALGTVAVAQRGGDSGDTVDRASELAALIGSEEQVDALNDSLVTKLEYQSAIGDMFTCVEQAGLILTDVGIAWSGIIYDYNVIVEEGEQDVLDACYREHAEAVDMAWQLVAAPVREAVETDVLECLHSNGVEPPEGAPDHPTLLSAIAPKEVWSSCVADAQVRDDVAPLILDPLEW